MSDKNKFNTLPVCTWCGSANVVFDGSLSYDPITRQYEINGTYDSTDCLNCDGECSVLWVWCDDKGERNYCSHSCYVAYNNVDCYCDECYIEEL